jgi:hypothetical protein
MMVLLSHIVILPPIPLKRINTNNLNLKPRFRSKLKKYYEILWQGNRKKVVKNADNKQVCCMDFLMNDVGKASLKQAQSIENVHDDNRIAGLMYCTYKTDNLLNSEIKDLIELFEMHDQVFIIKEDEVYKLHLTRENVHKLFLS